MLLHNNNLVCLGKDLAAFYRQLVDKEATRAAKRQKKS
jgi:hypothetical protein